MEAASWVLGTELRFFGRSIHALNLNHHFSNPKSRFLKEALKKIEVVLFVAYDREGSEMQLGCLIVTILNTFACLAQIGSAHHLT